jgi:hypothetical protein
MPPEDDELRKRRARLGSPSAPGIPGLRLPPAAPTPMRAAELESTPPEPFVVKQRAREQQTLVGVAPPARGAAPGPSTPPVSLPDPYSLPAPAGLPRMDPSVMAAVQRVPLLKTLAIIAGAATGIGGIITALGSAAVNIIVARRPPDVEQIQKDLDAVKKAQTGDFGLGKETAARLAEEKKLGEAVTAASTKAASCDGVAERVQKLEDKLKKR